MGSEGKFYKQTTLPSLQEKEGVEVPIPETIGPYKIETLLAKGGMSLLYLGIDPKDRSPKVIKVLSPSYVNHPEMADHFLWEAKIISLASHPNIVKLYDYGKWEEGLYIAMEFIRGVSLRQFLIQQSFSLKRCLDIILQTAYALLHLHTHGVIHRDLKPENILIAEDGEVKVIDFGIAQLHEDEKQPRLTHKIVGTPSYMSPEQKENPLNASFASDIFALGVITYELILGKLSYGMITLSLLPAGLQKIVGKAIAISQSERYDDIVHFITDLTDYYKSPAIEKDRPGSDLALETYEILQKAETSLSKLKPPNWPHLNLGLSKDKGMNELGLYIDFFKFANNTQAIVMATTHSSSISSSLHMASFRGMIKALIAPHIARELAFSPSLFANNLNVLICEDEMQETFELNILKLIPYQDTLIYFSAGESGPLFHVPSGGNSARMIHSENPLIGLDAASTFNETTDTFNDGDLFVFHNLHEEPFGKALFQAVQKNVLLSTNKLAEAVLDEARNVEGFKELGHPKAVLGLKRIS